LEHFKKEVISGFVMVVLKKLVGMHNIQEDEFKAELMTRYTMVSVQDVCIYRMRPRKWCMI